MSKTKMPKWMANQMAVARGCYEAQGPRGGFQDEPRDWLSLKFLIATHQETEEKCWLLFFHPILPGISDENPPLHHYLAIGKSFMEVRWIDEEDIKRTLVVENESDIYESIAFEVVATIDAFLDGYLEALYAPYNCEECEEASR